MRGQAVNKSLSPCLAVFVGRNGISEFHPVPDRYPVRPFGLYGHIRPPQAGGESRHLARHLADAHVNAVPLVIEFLIHHPAPLVVRL